MSLKIMYKSSNKYTCFKNAIKRHVNNFKHRVEFRGKTGWKPKS